jgi:hypothetical protein
MKSLAGGTILALAVLLACSACGGGSMSSAPAHTSSSTSSSTSTVSNPLTVAFSAHSGYSCTTISGTDFCPGEEFANLAVIPVNHSGITITRVTFLYTVGRPMLNAENFPPGPQPLVAQPCTTPPSINIGPPESPAYSLNLKSGGDANYPLDTNPALNDSGPIAVHLTGATEVSYGYGNPLDTVNPPNYGCWYGEKDGSVQGNLTIQYTTP